MSPAPVDPVPYQPRYRGRWWPDLLVALLIAAVPLLFLGSELLRGNWRSALETTAVTGLMMGLLLPWLPAAWSWFRLAPALGRVVERDFRLDLALTLRSPREILAGELASRAILSTFPAVSLVLAVVAGLACVAPALGGEEIALVLLIGGFCFVVATPVMVLLAWATLSILVRRRLAAGSGGWLSWSMLQLIVATVYLVLATYVLEFGVLMMLIFVAMLAERLGDPTELLPIAVMLGALVVVTVTIAGGLGWVILANLGAIERELWSFEGESLEGRTTSAPALSASARPPASLALFARLRLVLVALALPLLAFEGVGLYFTAFGEDTTVPEGFFVVSGLMTGLLLVLAAYDLRLVLARLRLAEATRHGPASTAMMVAFAQSAPWFLVAATLVSLPPALVAAGWSLAHESVLRFDAYRNVDVLMGLVMGAVWMAMAATTLALLDATSALGRPPQRPGPAAILLRLVGYPAVLGVGLMFAVAILMAPTMSVGFAGNGPSERLTAMLALGVWGGVVLCAMAAVMGWAAWRWMRVWNAARQGASSTQDS